MRECGGAGGAGGGERATIAALADKAPKDSGTGGVSAAQSRWLEWESFFREVDASEAACASMQRNLEAAVAEERYGDAGDILKHLRQTRQKTDCVGFIEEEMRNAVEQERYDDARLLRDEGGQALKGWWAGNAVDDTSGDVSPFARAHSEFPHGHIVHVSAQHGRYMAKAYVAEEFLDEDGEGIAGPELLAERGTPVFEVFVRPSARGAADGRGAMRASSSDTKCSEEMYEKQACSLRYTMDADFIDERAASFLFDDDEDEDDEEDESDAADGARIDGPGDPSVEEVSSTYSSADDADDDDDDDGDEEENGIGVSWRIDNLGVGIDIIYADGVDEDDDLDEEKDEDEAGDDQQGDGGLSFQSKQLTDSIRWGSVKGGDVENEDDDEESAADSLDDVDDVIVEGGYEIRAEDYVDDTLDEDEEAQAHISLGGKVVEIDLEDVPSIEEVIALASGTSMSSVVREKADILHRSANRFVFVKKEKDADEGAEVAHVIDSSDGSLQPADSLGLTTSWDASVEADVTEGENGERRPMLIAAQRLLSNRFGTKFLSPMTMFSRIPECLYEGAQTDPFQGIFVGTFGSHGPEIVRLVRGFWGRDRVDDYNCVTALKITGDANVPAGAPTFRVRVGREDRIRTPATLMEMNIQERYRGEGMVAKKGFKNARVVRGGLYSFVDQKLGFAWNVPGETKFMIIFHRLKL